jgi:hypothetical protein
MTIVSVSCEPPVDGLDALRFGDTPLPRVNSKGKDS